MRPRARICVACLLALLWAGTVLWPSTTSAQANGVLVGRVIDGTHDGHPLANIVVGLVVTRPTSSGLAFAERAVTDAHGMFTLAMPPRIGKGTYVVAALITGQTPVLQSYASLTALTAAAAVKGGLLLAYYTTTTSTTAITAPQVTLALAAASASSITVEQAWTLANRGHAEIIGPPDARGRHAVLTFHLAAGYRDLSTRDLLASATTWVSNSLLHVDAPLPPTSAFGPLVFLYTLPLLGTGSTQVVFTTQYAINTLSVVIPPTGLTVAGPPQLTQSTLTASKTTASVRLLTGHRIPAGAQLIFVVTLATSPSQAVVTPTASDTMNVPSALLLALGAASLLILLAVLARQHAQNAPTSAEIAGARPTSDSGGMLPQDPHVQRAYLTRLLAEMDDARERGDIDATDYQQRRAALKTELVHVIQALE